jgi:hypothetical protein
MNPHPKHHPWTLYKAPRDRYRKNFERNVCGECGKRFDPPGDHGLSREFSQHMVEAHGYRHEGAQTFKRKTCWVCAKPALYQVGWRPYCKEHVAAAQATYTTWAKEHIDRPMAIKAQQIKQADYRLLNREARIAQRRAMRVRTK